MKHTCEVGSRISCELCLLLEIELWDAINRYAIAVGGDPSPAHVYGNTPGMQAVVDVNKVVAQVRVSARGTTIDRLYAAIHATRGFLRGVARRPELGRGAQDLLDEAVVLDRVLEKEGLP